MPRVDDAALGPIAPRLVFEDEHVRVRVWIKVLAPGESSPPDRHEHDDVIVELGHGG